jgi:uncharacterized membrane protein
MNKIVQSKTFSIIEHAVIVAVFIALSAFFTELINSDFATVLSQHLPSIVTVATINIVLAAGKKYIDAKKVEVIEIDNTPGESAEVK